MQIQLNGKLYRQHYIYNVMYNLVHAIVNVSGFKNGITLLCCSDGLLRADTMERDQALYFRFYIKIYNVIYDLQYTIALKIRAQAIVGFVFLGPSSLWND